jgi:hypothetical protein
LLAFETELIGEHVFEVIGRHFVGEPVVDPGARSALARRGSAVRFF